MKYDFYTTYPNKWMQSDETFVRGYAFFNDKLYNSSQLTDLFRDISNMENFNELVKQLNGFFSIVHSNNEKIYIAVDRMRTIPIYYADTGGEILIGTDCEKIRNGVKSGNIEPINEAEYLITGYVTGTATLYDNIKQVPAAGTICIDSNGIKRNQYYNYYPQNERDRSTEKLLEELDKVLVSCFERLIQYADGRPIVLSMSGGYDSRLLVSMLSRLNYDPIIAITYGHAGSESEYANSICENLDLKWVYVDQSHKEWREWYPTEERKQLDLNCGLVDSLPTLGPAIPLKKLQNNKKIPDNSVIITGDSVTTTGEHITPELMQASYGSEKKYVDSILKNHYEFWGYDSHLEEEFRDNISKSISQVKDKKAMISSVESWDWKERQSKHILRTGLFDHFDLEWWYPLWDNEFMDYWLDVPVQHRYDRNLYETYVEELYANVADISLDAAKSSIHQRNPWIHTIEELLTGTPFKEPSEFIYKHYLSPRRYEDNPVWGMMKREQFSRLHSDRQVSHSYRALDVLGRISFDPPKDGQIAPQGYISSSDLQVPRITNSLAVTDDGSSGEDY